MGQVREAPVSQIEASRATASRLPAWWSPLICGLSAALLLGVTALLSPGLGSLASNVGVVALIAALAPLATLVLVEARARVRWLVLAVALVALGVVGVFSANAAYSFQIAQAEAHGAFPTALSDLRAQGEKPPYSQRLAQVYLDWAQYEIAHNVFDGAVTHLTDVATQFPTTPQAAQANALLPGAHLAWARYATSQRDPVTAGQQYHILLTTFAAAPEASQGRAEAPAAYLAWGTALYNAKFYGDADTSFQLIITGFPQSAQFGPARQGDARDLLDWAQQLTGAGIYDQAAQLYQRLVTSFSDTPPGLQAQTLVKRGVQVTGRLLKADGKTPADAGTTIRLSSAWTVGNGSYVASGQQYLADTDANGDFVFPAVPPGQYLLEWRSTTGAFQSTFNGATPTLIITVAPLNAVTLSTVTSDQK